MVEGGDVPAVLQRGLYYVRNGLLHKAVEEISSLDGSASFAMSGWVQHAQVCPKSLTSPVKSPISALKETC